MLEPESFDPYLNQTFSVNLPEGGAPVPLILKTVRRLPERTQGGLRARPFALDLHGPADRALRPGTYDLSWPDGSQRYWLLIQIVIGSGPRGAVYEVIFS